MPSLTIRHGILVGGLGRKRLGSRFLKQNSNKIGRKIRPILLHAEISIAPPNPGGGGGGLDGALAAGAALAVAAGADGAGLGAAAAP